MTLSRQIVVIASIAALVWGGPHLIYHLFNNDDLDGVDLIASLGGLVLFVGLPLALLLTARTRLSSP